MRRAGVPAAEAVLHVQQPGPAVRRSRSFSRRLRDAKTGPPQPLIQEFLFMIDYFSIDEAEMRRIANLHPAVKLGAVVILAIDLWLRFRLPVESSVPLVL